MIKLLPINSEQDRHIRVQFLLTKAGGRMLFYQGHKYHRQSHNQYKTRWQCVHNRPFRCLAVVHTYDDEFNSCAPRPEDASSSTRDTSIIARATISTRLGGSAGTIALLDVQPSYTLQFLRTKAGGRILLYQGYKYHRQSQNQLKTRWQCGNHRPFRCSAVVHTYNDEVIRINGDQSVKFPDHPHISKPPASSPSPWLVESRSTGLARLLEGSILYVGGSWLDSSSLLSKKLVSIWGLLLKLLFLPSTRGSRILFFAGYKFHRHYATGVKARWHCATRRKHGCLASLITVEDKINIKANCRIMHNHEPEEYPELGDYLKRPEHVDMRHFARPAEVLARSCSVVTVTCDTESMLQKSGGNARPTRD
ncbi:hypothetical protein MSG28_008214 [Choristoneura fumiferana]|uniref:Uncharacterized protein n=1 Tax=Choristoneura fumiferana TaxID=7141 RepID=A0ACC0JAG3_CHOFU|nr:hypothetical protein MSG28_008214 [Choristoneura fumiferana]